MEPTYLHNLNNSASLLASVLNISPDLQQLQQGKSFSKEKERERPGILCLGNFPWFQQFKFVSTINVGAQRNQGVLTSRWRFTAAVPQENEAAAPPCGLSSQQDRTRRIRPSCRQPNIPRCSSSRPFTWRNQETVNVSSLQRRCP